LAGRADHLLTIDLGTTSCKVSLFTTAGRLVASSQAGYPLRSPEPGAAEQDPADWQAALWQALERMAVDRPADMRAVVGIGPTAQMNAVVLLDDAGQALGPAQSSMDQRAVAHGTRLRAELLQRDLSIYVGRNSTCGRLAWMHDRYPDRAATCAHVLEARGLVIYWLTGELAGDASIGVRAWDPELVRLVGFTPEKMPPIYPPWQAAGRLRADVAKKFGLPAGVPVAVGTGDGACANVAVGAIGPGQGCFTLGTTGVVRCVLESPLPITETLPTFSFPFMEALWLGGALYPASACLQWLRELLRLPDGPADDPAWLEPLLPAAAALPPGTEGLIFLPFLFGLGPAGGETYASLRGLRYAHKTEHLLRATFEGTACAMRSVADYLESRGQAVRDWRATGGGMRIALWRQIIAAVLGRPIVLTNGDSSLGAAVIGAVAAGLYSDLTEAMAGMVQVQYEETPSAADVSAYQKVYADYVANGVPIEVA